MSTKTKQLPWVTEPQKVQEYAEIGHPNYGVLKIPRFGSLTPNEELAIADYYIGLKNESLSEAKIEIATILLKYRFDGSWTRSDTLEKIQSFALVEDLYNFANNERSRWVGNAYLVKFEGSHGYLAASNYANICGGVLANRPDIPGTYFVFANPESVPLGFIAADFPLTQEQPKK
ncbi:hypothetical protein VF14_03105 [Nostoc linckia z18]|uniref:Uncharacterized protein n=2 Tax=Nostoc linckia TaxID=92942 RepID=A0A9Q5ZGQ4_NOSLI|nr:hypothetical protein [Nostoc linckia]PHK42369.1 hypothetical protein VF12_03120 [Nostoc linckia z15]PHK46810.1 hypothetical protein VF13_08990 [Nostoc linckia z16]PHJ69139.1 hypothetical protein VF02_00575 [Nostoc linckia z1]PHJ73290.1 hypothetical protein VF05_01590 [Nostoc linckia z3]PHJ78637.1 hypothetical protein VF03_00575 [Nostoc linckia z2]